jgi:hypothetical protein
MGFRVSTGLKRIGGRKVETAGFSGSPILRYRHQELSYSREYVTQGTFGLSPGNVDIPRLGVNSSSQGLGQACPGNSGISHTTGNLD